MTERIPVSAEKKNRIALTVCAAAVALVVVLLMMPVMDFTSALYTKRSPNTFVGDEKYIEARAEVEAIAAGFGGDVETTEDITERVNSKGETTSLIVFSVRQTAQKTLADYLRAGLLPSHVLVALCTCVLLSAVLLFFSALGKLDLAHDEVAGGTRVMRKAAGFMALAALILVPVFVMSNNVEFGRRIGMAAQGQEVANAAQLLAKADAFLFGGTGGEQISDMLGGLKWETSPMLWLLLPALSIYLLGIIVLAQGSVGRTLLRGLLYAFVIAVSVIILYPFYIMLITAFRSPAETTDMYFLHMLPTKWIWSNLADIVNRGVLRYLGNSILLATGATAIAMLCGIPAAYALARMGFKGKNVFMGFVIMSQMFSPVVLLVGISQLMSTIRLNDSVIGLMFINAAFNQAFAIWLLRGTFVSISSEMEQAACIDGCSTVGALIHILLPMAAPGIVTTLIFVFINAWNEYTISTVLISTDANKPITVGITQFSSFNMIEWQYLFAASLLATIPVIILFMCIEKHLAAGLTAGGVKG